MYEPDDIARSIRRYLDLVLGDPWTLRLERREVGDEDRPVAVIETGALTTLRARETITQGEVESQLPVTITAYPALPEADETTDALRQGRADAATLASLLDRWVKHGVRVVTEDEDEKKTLWSGPYRIPLWDWAAVPLAGDRDEPETPHDILFVPRESATVEPIQDREDLRRWSVVCEFRVTAESPGTTRSEDEGYVVTEGLKGAFAPPPG